MITLYQLPRCWDIPNPGQFCVKLETYLRMTGLTYKTIETLPLFAPRRKLPYINDNGIQISDSRMIINHLKSSYDDILDRHLSAEQHAATKAWQRLLEEHLYWVIMYTRWNYTKTNWQANKQAIFAGLPSLLSELVASAYRYRIKAQIRGQGLARLTPDEVFKLGNEDIEAISLFLGGKPYFMGNEPTTLDASAYGMLINIIGCPIESPVKDYALSKKNIVDYCNRMQSKFFPELASI
ncbi:MAG TPA: glutathione S-transferase family protein [Methylobacter sp.]|jgi:glutathione S-transferase